MISIFGIISIVVALFSVAIIVLHNRLMAKRTPVDSYFTQLETLVRDRIEHLCHASTPDAELHTLCIQYVDMDIESMIRALPDIEHAHEANLQASDDAIPAIHETIIETINETIEALNQAINEYNSLITGNILMRLMAQALALTVLANYPPIRP
ncbi:MAG: hypothetical protein FWC92_07820 [Defluviitaleaceae bacterium]|nr:hypothetical protein [Defluviitaleaceae bacterium]